jgi:hypothetical protein
MFIMVSLLCIPPKKYDGGIKAKVWICAGGSCLILSACEAKIRRIRV